MFLLALLPCALLPWTFLLSLAPADRDAVLIVVGAAGDPEYQEQFDQWADKLAEISKQADARVLQIGRDNNNQGEAGAEKPDRERLQKLLASEFAGKNRLWIVMIGHGTFDGKTAKFNLRGPDVSAEELSGWLADRKEPTAIINCASASAPFVDRLSGTNRVCVSATKSGFEANATRFGGHFIASLDDSAADLDKDQQVSLLEAFLHASNRVAEFYERDGRLATEHAIIDDNADRKGTPADFFRGTRVEKQVATDGKTPAAIPDGPLAHQWCLLKSELERGYSAEFRQQRDAIEMTIEKLRSRKESMEETAYYAELEPLMVRLARLYQSLEQQATEPVAK